MGESDDLRSDEHWAAVADALKSRMTELKTTQKKLAADADVSISTLNELLAGTARRRHPHTLAAIAEAVGWPPDHLLRLSRGEELDPGAGHRGSADGLADEVLAIREEIRRINERLNALEAPESEDGR